MILNYQYRTSTAQTDPGFSQDAQLAERNKLRPKVVCISKDNMMERKRGETERDTPAVQVRH